MGIDRCPETTLYARMSKAILYADIVEMWRISSREAKNSGKLNRHFA